MIGICGAVLRGSASPTFMIRGAESETFTASIEEKVRARNARIRIASVPGTSHLAPLERPEQIGMLCTEWLARLRSDLMARVSYWTIARPEPARRAILKTEYSSAELMIVNAARLLRDGDVVFVGVGQPNLACNLAKRTHAPNLVLIYEAGVIGAEPARLPLSIGDPTLVSGALSVVSMYDIFSLYLQRGNIDVGFMGGAQIDKFGNINATVIGSDYAHPKTRLPGSGGAQEIAAWANRCYLMTPHQKRRFPERVDFVTSAGFLSNRAEREATGVRGAGMLAVVTDIGLMEPNEQGELMLTAVHPGRTAAEARENTGWPLQTSPNLADDERNHGAGIADPA